MSSERDTFLHKQERRQGRHVLRSPSLRGAVSVEASPLHIQCYHFPTEGVAWESDSGSVSLSA